MKMETVLPDNDHCLVNLSNSILKHFTGESYHHTLPGLDEILGQTACKNVVLIVVDGMGSNIMERNLPEDSFLRRHKIGSVSSQFPATTVASLNGIVSGKYPCETGWLGWDQYIEPLDETIEIYPNTIKDTETPAADYNVAQKFLGYTTIWDKIAKSGQAGSVVISPYDGVANIPAMGGLDEMTRMVQMACDRDGRKFIYVYYPEFDSVAHDFGPDSDMAVSILRKVDSAIERMARDDTLLVVTADHGMLLVDYETLSDYPDLFKMLARTTSIESRATNYFVKPEHVEKFPEEFYMVFSPDDFELLARQEVIKQKIFGLGEPHTLFDSMIGDFLSISKGSKCIRYDESGSMLKGHHAGISADETIVPLVVYEPKMVK